jgi:hypothetical protein
MGVAPLVVEEFRIQQSEFRRKARGLIRAAFSYRLLNPES